MNTHIRHLLTIALVSSSLVSAFVPQKTVQAAASTELASYAIGSLPGQLSVNQGVANYSVPIGVPAGVAGVEPELAFSYSSMGGGGSMGMGWGVGGLSAISRCGRTLEQDESRIGIEWLKSDRYCLDGQRLVVTSGTYGADGSEYTTEIQSFSRITAHGQAGNGPSWFSVETKAGQTIEYGNTADSRIEAHGRSEAFAWAQNKISDAVGNALMVTYQESANHIEFIPDEISYAGGKAKVVFHHSTLALSSQTTGYIAGSLLKQTQQLDSVEIISDAATLSRYNLSYLTGSLPHERKLTSISQCDAAGDCLSPVTFDWSNSPTGFAAPVRWHAELGWIYANLLNYGGGDHVEFFDVNGDGLSDKVIDRNPNTGTQDGLYVMLNQNGSFAPALKWHNRLAVPWSNNIDYAGGQHTQFADMNGDGLVDKVIDRDPNVTGTQATGLHVMLNNGTGFDDPVRWHNTLGWINANLLNYGGGEFVDLVEMNGDGLVDKVFDRNPNTGAQDGLYVMLNNGAGFDAAVRWHRQLGIYWANYLNYDASAFVQMLDINGDGLTDKVIDRNPDTAAEDGMYVMLNTGSGLAEPAAWHGELAVRWANQPSVNAGDNLQLRDMNGDGLPDKLIDRDPRIASATTSGLFVMLNTGIGFAEPTRWHNTLGVSWANYLRYGGGGNTDLVDVNGDGLLDKAFDRHPETGVQDGMYVMLNTGSGFLALEKWHAAFPVDWINSLTYANGQHTRLLDINGDGLPDKLIDRDTDPVDAQTTGLNVMLNQGNAQLLTGVTGSLGDTLQIEYGLGVKTSLYARDYGSDYPFINTGAGRLVESVIKDNGQGGTTSTHYRYGGAKVHARGRGFLGYAWDEVTDGSTGITTRTEYRQDFPFVGMPKLVKTTKADETVLSLSTSSYDENVTTYNESLNGVDYQARFPYLTNKVDQSFELDGSSVSTVTTNHSGYDIFGNVGLVEVITVAGGETYKKLTTNTYFDNDPNYQNNINLWHIGRLREASVVHTHHNGSSIERQSAFEYDPTTGLLNKETIEPGSPFEQITRYQYDAFGNKREVSVSGLNGATRITSTDYDVIGRFPIFVTNALGHTEFRIYDEVKGKVKSLTGPNGLMTQWEYDSWGRKVAEHRADGTSSLIKREWVSDIDTHAPVNAIYKVSTRSPVILNAAGSIESSAGPAGTQYYDMLGRVIRKLSFGFDGKATYQDVSFDAQGREERSSLPYFQDDTSYWAVNHYDEVNRVNKKTFDSGKGTITTQITFDGLVTTSTNTLGQNKITVKNAQGKVAEVIDEEGGRVTYEYDAIGNLLKTHQHDDVNGKIITTELQYDIRGQKIGMIDPDMGTWTYTYDTFGDLIQQRDAKGQTVDMQYDALGRMTLRQEISGTTTWQYDNALSGHGVGKLERVSQYDAANNLTYRQEPSYDLYGRVNASSTQIDDEVFATATDYDEFGRVYKTYRPNGFEVRNLYNANGYLLAKQSPAETLTTAQLANLQSDYDQALINVLAVEDQKTLLQSQVEDWRSEAMSKEALALSYEESAAAFVPVADRKAYLNQVVSGNAQSLEAHASAPKLHSPYNVYTDANGEIYLELIDKDPLHAQGHYIWLSYGHNHTPKTETQWQNEILPTLTLQNKQLMFSDINADGQLDFLYSDQAGADFDPILLHAKYLLAIEGNVDANLAAIVTNGAQWVGKNLSWSAFGVPYAVWRNSSESTYEFYKIREGSEIAGISLYHYGAKFAQLRMASYVQSQWDTQLAGGLADSGLEFMIGDFNDDPFIDYVYSDQAPWLFSQGSGDTGTLAEQAAALRAEAADLLLQADNAEQQAIPEIDAQIVNLNNHLNTLLTQMAGGNTLVYSNHISGLYDDALASATSAMAAVTLYAEKAAYLQQKASEYEAAVGLVSPEADTALLTELIDLAAEIRAVARQLNAWADDGLTVAEQLMTLMSYVQDHQRQAQYWVDSSQPEDLDSMLADEGYTTWWRATTRDAAGRLSGHRTGNGLVTIQDYDPATGQLNTIQSGFGFGNLIRSLDYEYDALNNVTARYDNVQNVQETFVYDRLNRLTESTVDGEQSGVPYTTQLNYTYDALGNMLNKSDVGQYQYGDINKSPGDLAGPHAIRQVDREGGFSDQYEYDANGSMLRGGGREVRWTSFNKPSYFAKDGNVIEFAYGPDRKRYKKTSVDDFTAKTTLYLGKAYERIEDVNGEITHKHFVYVEGQIAAIHIEKDDDSVDKTRYLHRDSLGSIDTITDETGNVLDRSGYSPFGTRRSGNWETIAGIDLALYTKRGFTGHEHIDEVGLIHMNGRVYDPELGRFLSADPHVQAPFNSQSYNRYSYALNNPLKYTDPSGYFFKKLFRAAKNLLKNKFVRLFVAIAFAAIAGPAVFWNLAATTSLSIAGATIVSGALVGFGAGLIASGGNLKAGVVGAISGGLAGFIGASEVFGAIGDATVERVVAHGVSGGVTSEISGGKFIDGFVSGAFAKSIAGHIKTNFQGNPIGGAIASAVAGGASRSAMGGKFANGAITAGFSYLFNSCGIGDCTSKSKRSWTDDVKDWWKGRTNFPSSGKTAAGGVGWDGIVGDEGHTGGVGVVKFDFNNDFSTDAVGVYYYGSQEVLGLDAGVQLEYVYAPRGGFQGISNEVGGSLVMDLSVANADGFSSGSDSQNITIGAGYGVGGHTAKIRTRVFLIWRK